MRAAQARKKIGVAGTRPSPRQHEARKPQRPSRADGAAGTDRRLSHTLRAYREIKRRILENELPAGSQALEQELAAMLAMSRTPVREALIRLAHDGMVEIRPRHGMRVLPMSATDIAEIYDILAGLEPVAAGLAARRGLAEAEIRPLDQAVAAMEAALARDDLKAWAAADAKFHLLLVKLSGNRRLVALINNFWDQAHRVRMATLRLRPKPVMSNRDHAAVVKAIRERDPETARRIHQEHRLRAGTMLIDLLLRYGLTQL